MKVNIKEFNVQMDVKWKGVEFEVHNNEGKHLGDLVITKTNVIWCKGRARRSKGGKKIPWEKFIQKMEGNEKPSQKLKVQNI